MGVRFTDAELLAFIGDYRRASSDPHQDFGDVGFVFEEIEDHLLLEELVAARKVISELREHMPLRLGEALAGYDRLFADAEEKLSHV